MSEQGPNGQKGGGAPHVDPNDPIYRDPLLNHEYDGIREYDNPTPGWWHLIFFGSVLFSLIYGVFFHFSPVAWTIYDSWEAAEAAFFQKQFAKFGDLEPNEETIAGLMANENYMNVMKATFQGKCVSCHGDQGQGLVGPSLVDEEYLHIETLPDIYRVLEEGVVTKGMPAWGRQMQETELILLSAYVGSLRGRDVPAGKPPEGDPAPPWPDVEPLTFEEEGAEGG